MGRWSRGAVVGAWLTACGVPPCGDGYVLADNGGCVVDLGDPCPEGQIKDVEGTCIDPFFETTRDTAAGTHSGPVDPIDDTDADTPGRGDRCDWVVVTEIVRDPAQVGWQVRDAEADVEVLASAPGALVEVGTHRSEPVSLDEGVQYTLRALDLGADGWGAGAGVRVELASDPFRVAMANTLAAGSEGSFPFSVLCPAP